MTGDDRYENSARSEPRAFGGSGANGARSGSPGGAAHPQARPGFALDPWTLADAVVQRLHWILLAAGMLALVTWLYTQYHWRNTYTASVQLMRSEAPNSTVFYKPRQLTDHTFATLLKAPELLERVSRQAQPHITPDALAARVVISPARESEIVVVMVTGTQMRDTIALANLYATQAGEFTRKFQTNEAAEANEALKLQLSRMDAEIDSNNRMLTAIPPGAQRPAQRTSQYEEKLQHAQDELRVLQIRYLDAHPLVQNKRTEIEVLKSQIVELRAKSGQPAAKQNPGADEDSELLRSRLTALANSRLDLASRQREAQMYLENPPGYCKILTPATEKDVAIRKSKPKIVFMTVVAGLVGLFGGIFVVLLAEVVDPRLKSSRDVARVTELPVIATLGNLDIMTPAEQRNWAFRTWTSIQGKLSSSPNHGLVCGITSASKREGRSTWVNMLAQAASECGFRVLTVATLPPNAPNEAPQLPGANGHAPQLLDHANRALTTNVLSSPSQVTEQLTGDDPQPMVHIPLPGWVWNLERRKQWQAALNQWRSIENIVILVELPPASEPEAVLLAQNLPNLIWLADSGVVHAGPTRQQLQTLRDARCNLVGSVVNHERQGRFKDRLSRWSACIALAVCLGFGSNLHAAEQVVPSEPPAQPESAAAPAAKPAPPGSVPDLSPVPSGAPELAPERRANINTNLSFSAVSGAKRAGWQRRFTLGPGDLLNFSMFGQPELNQAEVPIGPDGRVSYLQAQDVLASGLTVDELRTKIDEELSKFYRSPHSIVTPAAYNSKKYYVLGKVVNRGVFPLDRPISIVEALARAKGLETGILDNQNSVDLVDLQRSFLMRAGKRLPLNLEQLFQQGDLSQNIGIEPEDYLYFAPGAIKEVYVLGEVRAPGPQPWTENTTVIAALSARGGFTDRAYKTRVLVIRGSLDAPKTFIVDTWATMDARSRDFKLEPKDIVYVSWRPFIKVEELLDIAATAFIQSAVAAWAGKNIGPIISHPVIPNL